MSNQFAAKLREKKITFGIYELAPSPELVELVGYLKYDFVVIDQMFTSVDWTRAAEMIRAAQAFGISSVIRVQTDPWRSSNPNLSSDVARALSLGANGVMVSVGSVEEVRTALSVAQDWHRRVYISEPRKSGAMHAQETIVTPLIESEGSIADLEKIVALPGMQLVSLGMGDLSRVLGSPGQVEDKRVWDLVDRTVSLAARHGVSVCSNTGRQFRTVAEIEARARRLHDHGVNCIMTQHSTQLLQYFCEELLGRLRTIAPSP